MNGLVTFVLKGKETAKLSKGTSSFGLSSLLHLIAAAGVSGQCDSMKTQSMVIFSRIVPKL